MADRSGTGAISHAAHVPGAFARPAELNISGVIHRLAWAAAAITAGVTVWLMQVSNRAPLVWDEATRVDAGAALTNTIRSGDFIGSWQWIQVQVFYPFLAPALNGVVLLITNNPLAAAWVPAVFAYVVAGLLAGRLSTDLGAGAVGAWCAALLTWTTPIFARVSGGAWTEPLGACLILTLLIALVRLERKGDLRIAAVTGFLAALCWFLKYDYGILGMGTLGLSGLVALLDSQHRRERFKRYCVALSAAIIPVAGWFSVNPAGKLSVILQFAGHVAPDTANRFDLTYYPTALFGGGEVGVTPVIAFLFAASVVSAALQIRRRDLRPALICLCLWYLIYSLAGARYSRYLGTIMPLLATFGGLAAGQFITRTHFESLRIQRIVVPITALAIIAQLAFQVTAPTTGLAAQFWFLKANPSASDVVAFASTHLQPDSGPVLMLGQTIEFSSYALHLAWSERLGYIAPPVDFIGETGQPVTPESFMAQVRSTGAHQIVGVEIRPGSSFDSADYRVAFPSQPEYLVLARSFAAAGVLTTAASLSLENGDLSVVIWDYGNP